MTNYNDRELLTSFLHGNEDAFRIQADLNLPAFPIRIGPICESKTTTDAHGHFSLPKMFPGRYDTQVQRDITNHAPGSANIKLRPSQSAALTIHLQ